MAGTIETWWWPLGEFNGGGDDGFLTTSNYPYRVWGWLKAMGMVNVSYPPLGKISYLLNGQTAPDNRVVSYSANEISSSDDSLYPTPALLGSSSGSGIRWTKGDYSPFTEVILHRNDGTQWP